MTAPGSAVAQPGPAPPRCFPMYYGPEFVTKAVREWITTLGAKTAYIEPGRPWENSDSKLWDEPLNGEIFYILKEA